MSLVIDSDCTESVKSTLDSMIILAILILPIEEHSISLYLFLLSAISFVNMFQFFGVLVLCLLRQVSIQLSLSGVSDSVTAQTAAHQASIPRYFIVFDAVVNWDCFLNFSFRYFIVGVQKCNRFLHINFVSCNFTEFIDELQQFSGSIFRIFYVYHQVICEQGQFYFFTWIPFVSFSSLIAVLRTSKTMLHKSGESGHPCLVLDLRGNAFNFSLLSMMLAVVLSYMGFIMLSYILSITTF